MSARAREGEMPPNEFRPKTGGRCTKLDAA